MTPYNLKRLNDAAARLIAKGTHSITVLELECEVVVTDKEKRHTVVHTYEEFLEKYDPMHIDATADFSDLELRAQARQLDFQREYTTIKSLTPGQDAEIVALRRRIQQLENERSDLVMGASIKLAAARQVLQRLIPTLHGADQQALQAVFDVLHAGSPTGRITNDKPATQRYIK